MNVKLLFRVIFVLTAACLGLFWPTASDAIWDVETVDEDGDVGWYACLALDNSNQPHISYYDATTYTTEAIKYAVFNGTSWSVQPVESGSSCGLYTSIALDSSQRPHITYYNSGDLRYALWNGSDWDISTLSTSNFYHSTTIKIGTDNTRHVVFSSSGETGGTIYYLKYSGGGWGTVDDVTSADGPMESSMVLDSSNNPHIAYSVNSGTGGGDMGYVRWTGSDWATPTPVPDSSENDGYWPSLDLDSNQRPHISHCDIRTQRESPTPANPDPVPYHYEGNLQYAYYNGGNWVTDNVPEPQPTTPTGWYSSIQIGSGDYTHIAYQDHAHWSLKYITNRSGSWKAEVVDDVDAVGYCNSMKLDNSGFPHIAYYDVGNRNLKYARWADGPYTISGRVADGSSTPFEGVYIFLSGNNITSCDITAADGTYAMVSIPAGNYTVSPVLAGYSFTPTQHVYSGLNQNYANHDFTIATATGGAYIRGYVVNNVTGYAVAGVRVTISGDTQGNTTTGNTGYYEFNNLPVGDYAVTPFKENWSFSPSSRSYTGLSLNQDDQRFNGTDNSTAPTGNYLIRGYIRDLSGAPVEGVVVTLSGPMNGQYTTGANGFYGFSELVSGDYSVTVQHGSWAFSPNGRTYTALSQDQDQQDYAAIPPGFQTPVEDLKIIPSLVKPRTQDHATLFYGISRTGRVTIKIYTIDGVLVKTLVDEDQLAGQHQVQWNCTTMHNEVVASGIYLVDTQTPNYRKTRKICIVK